PWPSLRAIVGAADPAGVRRARRQRATAKVRARAPASEARSKPHPRPTGEDMSALLEVSNLEVRYGDLIGVADVSLVVPRGTIVALLGSNGAGKPSTLNAIAGLVPASRGQIKLENCDITGEPAYAIVRRGLALSPEGWRLFVQQSVENNLLLGATPLA